MKVRDIGRRWKKGVWGGGGAGRWERQNILEACSRLRGVDDTGQKRGLQTGEECTYEGHPPSRKTIEIRGMSGKGGPVETCLGGEKTKRQKRGKKA